MKLDVRQVLDIVGECGFTLLEKGRPQSQDNWDIDSEYEFENEFKALSVMFTIDPLPGYLAPKNRKSARKQKNTNTLDEVQVRVVDKYTRVQCEEAFDLRNSSPEEIHRLKRFITF